MPSADAPPSLLFRQYCLLAGAAGVAALREPLAACLALAVLTVYNLATPRGLGRTAVLVVCFSLALGYASFREPQPPPVPDWLERAAAPTVSPAGDNLPPAPVALTGLVESREPLPENRLRLILTDIRPAAEPTAPSYTGKLIVTFNTPPAQALRGMEARLTLRVTPVRSYTNPQVQDRDRLLADAGIFFTGSHGKNMPWPEFSGRPDWSAGLRAALQARFLSALSMVAGGEDMTGSPLGYAPALMFNDRSLLTSEQIQRLADAGIIHSLALSGMHLGYATAAGCIVLWGLARLRPGIFLRLSRPRAVVLFGLPAVLLCLWMGQAPVTLIRAFFMFLFWGLLIFLGRPKVLLDGLLAALGLMLLLTPTALFDIRLQLSFAAVGAIALSLPLVTSVVGKALPKPTSGGFFKRLAHSCLSGGCSLMLVSTIIQLALLPLAAFGFTATPVLAPLNVPWLPVLGVWVMPLLYLSVALCAISPALAAPVLYIAALPLEALDALLVFLRHHDLLRVAALPRPYPVSALGWWVLLLVGGEMLYARSRAAGRGYSPAVRAGLCAAAVAMLLAPAHLAAPGSREARLTVLDVGSGQALLLEWSGGRALLDGGPAFPKGTDSGRFITGPVAAYGAMPRLDLVLASHPDADHLGGLLFVLEHFQVDTFGGNGYRAHPEVAERLDRALAGAGLREQVYARGDVLEYPGGMRLEVLWPPKEGGLKGNDASLVIRIIHQGRPLAVACGDAGRPALEKLAHLDGRALAAPVLILSHHGSAGALCPAFYDAVAPGLVVASCRQNNQWGFPAGRIRDEWMARGIPLLDTGKYGQIRITREGPAGELVIRTARNEP